MILCKSRGCERNAEFCCLHCNQYTRCGEHVVRSDSRGWRLCPKCHYQLQTPTHYEPDDQVSRG